MNFYFINFFIAGFAYSDQEFMENYHRNSSTNSADNCTDHTWYFFSTQLFKQWWTKPNHSVCIIWSTLTTNQNSQWSMVGHSAISSQQFSNLHSHRCYWINLFTSPLHYAGADPGFQEGGAQSMRAQNFWPRPKVAKPRLLIAAIAEFWATFWL